MRVDAHQHFWKYDPVSYAWITPKMSHIRRDFVPRDLIPLLEKEGFDGSIAVQALQTEKETEYLLTLAESYNAIKGVVGWVDLKDPYVNDRLSYFSEYTYLKGIRHVVQSEPDDQFLLRKDFQRGVSYLSQFGLVYDILIYPKQLPATIQFVRKFEDQIFVLDHIAKPHIAAGIIEPWKSLIVELAQSPHVYCKLSGMVTEAAWNNWTYDQILPYLEVVINAFGSHRLMIGSDWPVCTLASNYSQTIGIVKRFTSELSIVEQERIFGANATSCYKL